MVALRYIGLKLRSDPVRLSEVEGRPGGATFGKPATPACLR